MHAPKHCVRQVRFRLTSASSQHQFLSDPISKLAGGRVDKTMLEISFSWGRRCLCLVHISLHVASAYTWTAVALSAAQEPGVSAHYTIINYVSLNDGKEQ